MVSAHVQGAMVGRRALLRGVGTASGALLAAGLLVACSGGVRQAPPPAVAQSTSTALSPLATSGRVPSNTAASSRATISRQVPSSANTTASIAADTVTLDVAYPYFGADKTIFPEIFAAFEKGSGGHRIDNAYGPAGFQQFAQKVETAVASGAGPDVVVSHPNWFASWVGKGLLVDLAPYTGRDRSINIDEFYPSALANVQFKGKLYGIPYYFGPAVFYYNKSILDKAGAADPNDLEKVGKWDWSAFIAMAQQTTTGEGSARTFGYDSLSASLADLATWIWSNGGREWNDALTESTLDQPADVAALESQAGLTTKYRVVPTPDDKVQQGFQTGRVAMIDSARWNVPNLKLLPSLQLGTAPIPKGLAGRRVYAGGQGWCIMQGSKQKDLAWEFLKFGPTEPAQAPLLSAGRSQPVSRAVASSPTYEQSLLPWESATVYADAAEHSKAFRAPVQVQQLQSAFTTQWNAVVAGKQSMQTAMTTYVQQAHALLQSG